MGGGLVVGRVGKVPDFWVPEYSMCDDGIREHTFQLGIQGAWATRVVVGHGALGGLPASWPADASRAFVIGDANVLGRFGSEVAGRLRRLGVDATLLPFAPGEASKSRRTWGRLIDRLDRLDADRQSVVVGLGGGVSTDLAGFVAATALRGLRGILLPTSLLAMADAALGGKVGLDTPGGKNRVGTMWWPLAVLADTSLLASLPPAEIRHGVAEMAKAALIGDPALLDLLADQAPGLAAGRPPSDEAIARAAAVKLDIVERDPVEGGERRVLNLGHTVAHAIEAASGWRVPHGAAVAVGLRVESRIATRLLGFPDEAARRLSGVLDGVGLPSSIPGCRYQDAAPFLVRDKKVQGGRLRFALPEAPGRMTRGDGGWTVAVGPEIVEACWHGTD